MGNNAATNPGRNEEALRSEASKEKISIKNQEALQ